MKIIGMLSGAACIVASIGAGFIGVEAQGSAEPYLSTASSTDTYWRSTSSFISPTGARPVVARPFEPPEQRWLAGHRGVDLELEEGAPILAAGEGTVRFTGFVVNRPVITLEHTDILTTYEPVDPIVNVGDTVQQGDVIGFLLPGHEGPASSTSSLLHWGAKRSGEYINPLALLGLISVRLWE